jgi:predicted Ser/Thr protein kinase
VPLTPGSPFGPYTIVAPLGAGGMGEVYRARDSKLDRDVALKILPESFATDPDRLMRFEREAKTLASLNHPNIAAIYGVQENALVMELVEGRDLSDVIGAMPLDEALAIARQIAEALEAAHDAGIVHRDLKPANVKVRDDGTVKVLDFGLAKAMDPPSPSATAGKSPGTIANSPTMTSPAMTAMGMILGTAAYMSPEQAKGRPVDRRADIWAFGVVLYEMLSGKRAFTGEDVSDLLVAVLSKDVDWSALPATTPASIVTLLRRCLERDPKRRLRDIGEARLVLANPDASVTAVMAAVPAGPSRNQLVFAAVVILAAITAAWMLGRASAPAPAEGIVAKSHIAVQGDGTEIRGGVVSPDGRMVVFSAGNALWVQRLDQWTPRELVSIDTTTMAAWSPASDAVVYATNTRLMRVAVNGGVATPVATLPTTMGAMRSDLMSITWRDDGQVFFSGSDGPTFRVAATGGDPVVAWEPLPPASAGGRTQDYHGVQALPGREELLAVLHRDSGNDAIVVLEAGGVRTILDTPGRDFRRAMYAPSGHLVFSRPDEDSIWAVGFSLSTLTTTGEPFPIAEGRTPSVSDDGALYFVAAPTTAKRQLTWMTRTGVPTPTTIPAQLWNDGLAFDKEGRRVAAADADGLWSYDLESGARSRLVSGSDASNAVWLNDGRVAFTRDRDGTPSVVIASANGSGEETVVSRLARYPSVPASGSILVFNVREEGAWRLAWVDLRTPDKITTLKVPGNARFPAISPDGTLLAYVSNETTRDEIWATRFPSGEGRWQVSTNGGGFVQWSPSGTELFYRGRGDDLTPALKSVPVRPGAEVPFGPETTWFKWGNGWDAWYAVARDGRVLVSASAGQPDIASVRVIRNWFLEFPGK